MNYNNQSNMKSNHIKSDGDRIRCDQRTGKSMLHAELVKKKNIDFDVLLHTYNREQDLVEEIYQLILETVQTEKDMIRSCRRILSWRLCEKGKITETELFAYRVCAGVHG